MLKIKGGKRALAKAVFRGDNIFFRVKENKIEWEENIMGNWLNIWKYETIKQAYQGVNQIIERAENAI